MKKLLLIVAASGLVFSGCSFKAPYIQPYVNGALLTIKFTTLPHSVTKAPAVERQPSSIELEARTIAREIAGAKLLASQGPDMTFSAR